MNDDVKKRIKMINNGEVPDGYKDTEVGIVPTEWEETTLSEIFTFKNGLNKEKEAFGEGTPIINYVDVYKKRGLKADDLKGKVELSKKEIDNYRVQKGDVFFTRTSETVDEIGLTSVILDDVKDTVFSGFVLRARPINDKICIVYNQFCYSSNLMRNEVKKKSSCTTRALTNGTFLGEVNINLPSKPEQQKIADILMKWDEAVVLQEKLIEKLEIKRKALMQKLLMPKEGWEKTKLSDVLREGSKERVPDTSKYKKITIKLNFNGLEFTDTKREMADTRPFYVRKKGEIIIGKQNYFNGSIAMVTDEFDGCICSNAIMSFCVIDNNNVFVFKSLSQPNFIKRYSCLANGTGQKELAESDFLKFEILLPPLSEQDKIAEVMMYLDKSIDLHKQKLIKLKQQQKAMMQLLLTGIVRVN